MKRSSLHQSAIQAVCHALFQGQITAIPSLEDFLKQFCPKLAKPYEYRPPLGGIRISANGRPVNWGQKSARQAQQTKRDNEAARIYADCVAIIESQLSATNQQTQQK